MAMGGAKSWERGGLDDCAYTARSSTHTSNIGIAVIELLSANCCDCTKKFKLSFLNKDSLNIIT